MFVSYSKFAWSGRWSLLTAINTVLASLHNKKHDAADVGTLAVHIQHLVCPVMWPDPLVNDRFDLPPQREH
ncbi:Potassium-transporting ATPase potassium-binding subunit [Trichinella pseudospiralis]